MSNLWLAATRRHHYTLCSAKHSLVFRVPNFLGLVQTAVIVAKRVLLEGFGLVKFHAVERAHLVGVRVLLCAPVSAVPELSVCRVAAGQLVALERSHLQHLGLLKVNRSVAGAPVGAELRPRVVVRSAESGLSVVDRVAACGGTDLGFRAEATGRCVQLSILARDQRAVETAGRKGILRGVQGRGVENLASLFGDRLSQMVVVLSDSRAIASIAGNDSALLFNGSLFQNLILSIVLPLRTCHAKKCDNGYCSTT